MATVLKTSIIDKSNGLATIRIEGSGFGAAQGANNAQVNDVQMTVVSWSDTEIVGTVADNILVGDIAVSSVNGQVGTVNLTAADVGASPAGHTHDSAYEAKNSNIQAHISTPHLQLGSTSTTAAAGDHAHDAAYSATGHGHANTEITGLGTASTVNTGNGPGNVPVLDQNGKLNASTISSMFIVDVFNASTEAQMLALPGVDKGDICMRSDINKTYVLKATPASTLSNWAEILAPNSVVSVDGKTGIVNLSADYAPLSHVDTTDGSASAKHHTLGTGQYQAAPGNHTHEGLGSSEIVMTLPAGENLNAGDLCKIINEGGLKAYKFMTKLMAGTSGMFPSSYFQTGGTYSSAISAASLTSTSAVIAFQDNDNLNKGKVVLVTVSGENTLSCSVPAYLVSGGTNNASIRVARLTDTSAIACFQDNGDSGRGKTVVITASGGTVSCGTPAYLITGGAVNSYMSIAGMTSTTALIAFCDESSGGKGRAVVATVSGSSVTCGSSSYIVSGGTTSYATAVTRMTDTTAIVAFSDNSNSGKGMAALATISGSSVTCSAASYIVSGGTIIPESGLTRLTDTKAIVVVQDGGDSYKGKASLITVTGGVLSFSSYVYLVSGGTNNSWFGITSLTSNSAVVAFKDAAENKGKVVLVTESNGSLAISAASYIVAGGTNNVAISAARLSDVSALIAFQDVANSNKGKAAVFSVQYEVLHDTIPVIAKTTATASASADFVVASGTAKVTNAAYSLTPGAQYFINSSNVITTTPSEYYVGTALDATTLLIDTAPVTKNSVVYSPVSLVRYK